MLKLTLKELGAHKRRLFSTAFAVLLGVAFLAGTFVFVDSMSTTLNGVFADGNKHTDAFVRAPVALDVGFGQPRPGIPAELASTIASVSGVTAVAPRVQGYAQVIDPAGRTVGDQKNGSPVFGQNWVVSPTLNPYRIVAGRAPRGSGEVALDRASARSAHLEPGDRVKVLTKRTPRTVTIVGVATFGKASSFGGAHTILFNDGDAQNLLAEPGKVDGFAVAAERGVAQPELARRIDARLREAGKPASQIEVVTGAELTSETQSAAEDSLSTFRSFMLIFAGIAVFVGAFIINNTFSILVAQRTRGFALLRAVGANGRQILSSVLGESIVVGTLASAAGVGVGFAVARGLRFMLGQFGFELPAGPLALQPRTIVVSMSVGIAVTVVSAMLPARRAAKTPPLAALRDVALDRSATSRARAAVGVVASASGAAMLLAGLSGNGEAALVGVGAVVVFLGVAILGPIIARPFVRIVGVPLPRLRGMTGTLARENAARNPKRTARTAAALMIGVGLVGFITILASSSKASIAGSLERNYRGDYAIDSGDFTGAGGLSPELAASLRGAPGVAAVSANRVVTAKVGTALFQPLNGWDTATVGQLADLGHVQGSVTTLGRAGLAVEKEYAAARAWRVGSVVPVTFAEGSRRFTVRALFDRSDDLLGKVFVGNEALPGQLDSRVFVKSEGAPTAALSAVRSAASSYPASKVLDRKALTKDVEAEIDTILAVIYAMLALAVVIALLGIANTLSLSVHERTRELGLLRAVGMTRTQLRASVRWESVLIALFGTGLGLAVGSFFGWAMVRALADEGVDQLSIPAGALGVVTLIAAVAGIAAAIRPARRAARLDVLQAVAGS